MVTPDAKRDAVAHACLVHGVSQRRACEALEVDRSSVRYRSMRPDDRELREAIKAVASQRRRFGYRRIHVMLQRQGIDAETAAGWTGAVFHSMSYDSSRAHAATFAELVHEQTPGGLNEGILNGMRCASALRCLSLHSF
jgi:hypothetical protein